MSQDMQAGKVDTVDGHATLTFKRFLPVRSRGTDQLPSGSRLSSFSMNIITSQFPRCQMEHKPW